MSLDQLGSEQVNPVYPQQGAMYGEEGRYHSALPEGFEEHVWIELIGFDHQSSDYGVKKLLDTMGFKPAAFLLLVTSVDFVHEHRGMEAEYELNPFFCSYWGHGYNDERPRQAWTNYQLKGLVETLRSYGIQSYISMFDMLPPGSAFAKEHPEVMRVDCINGKLQVSECVYATKYFADGTTYADYLLEKGIKMLKDYGFDGIHLADGICRPRLPIQTADYSDQMLELAGIKVPDNCDRSLCVAQNHRREWVTFCTDRWMEFLEKTVNGFHDAGYLVAVNNAWQKDPMEAMYRYGVDYNLLANLPIETIVIENGAPTNAILDDDANAGYHQSYEDRKLVHHYLRAALMMEAACFDRRIPLRPLFPVRDTMEQYDVIHHMPTALVRHSGAVFNSFLWEPDGKVSPVISGNTYCLGDGLSFDNWRFLRLCGDNAYIADPLEAKGVTVIWSQERTYREIDALINKRTWSSVKWMAELMRRGASVSKVARIEYLDAVQGDILVPNPHLMPEAELKKVKAYKGGEIIYISEFGDVSTAPDGYSPDEKTQYSGELNPVGIGFPYPLFFAEVEEQILANCVARINRELPYVSKYEKECHVQEIRTGENTSTFLIDNEEYYYAVPTVQTGRPIKSARELTKLIGYNLRIQGETFRTLVPLRGMAIVEVEFEDAIEK